MIVSTSFGNDSCALIQWCVEHDYDVELVYVDTGWASSEWPERVDKMINHFPYKTTILKPVIQFEELIKLKQGFPNQRYQWCTGLLKGVPFLQYLDDIDPDKKQITLIGKRRDESEERKNTPRMSVSEYHGFRWISHPLYKHSDDMRNDLLARAGIDVLPHRSHECHPCVNANRIDFLAMNADDINRTEALEKAVNKTMFRPKRHNGAKGIRQVIDWAKYGEGKYHPDQDDLFGDVGCGSPFGCGL